MDKVILNCRCGCDLSLVVEEEINHKYDPDEDRFMGPNDHISVCSDVRMNRKLNKFPEGHGDFWFPNDTKFGIYDFMTVINRTTGKEIFPKTHLWHKINRPANEIPCQ